jgi:hypothetical protein
VEEEERVYKQRQIGGYGDIQCAITAQKPWIYS